MKQKYIDSYMTVANTFSQLSSAVRLKVGAIIVKQDRIISIGYNGTLPGQFNECEYTETDAATGETKLVTKPDVIHAEMNAIGKLARSQESGEGAVMFCTHLPCMECAKLIAVSGLSKVYYQHEYRSDAGKVLLESNGVVVEKCK